MTPAEQLEIITSGRVWDAVREYLNGDWSRRNELFTIPRSTFDAWADSIELPHGCIYREPHTWDGVYVAETVDRWAVYYQERGQQVADLGSFPDYRTAKRAALASEYLHGITLPSA